MNTWLIGLLVVGVVLVACILWYRAGGGCVSAFETRRTFTNIFDGKALYISSPSMNEGNVYRTLGFMSLNDSMSRLIVLAGAYDNSGEGSSSYRETDVHFEDGIAKITMQTVMLDVIPLDSLGAKIKAIIKIPIEGPKYDVAEIIYGRIPIPEVRVEGTV